MKKKNEKKRSLQRLVVNDNKDFISLVAQSTCVVLPFQNRHIKNKKNMKNESNTVSVGRKNMYLKVWGKKRKKKKKKKEKKRRRLKSSSLQIYTRLGVSE